MKVIILCPYPHAKAPSQRFRFEQYLTAMEDSGIRYKQLSFMSDRGWEVLYAQGKFLQKIFYLLLGFGRRKLHLFSCISADRVFIHREASPVGPPVFEWILAKLMRKKIIYDFDDAIWISNTSEQNKMAAYFKFHGKVKHICRWAFKVSAGNQFLVDYAKQWNENAVLNPTTIDTEHWHNQELYQKPKNPKPIIGWTGTHSTLPYLDSLWPILDKLSEKFDFEFQVIANLPPAVNFPWLRFIKWSKENEIEDLLRFDIGVMPLTEDLWSEGKCGFKALQYMALEIPCVASPIGVNKQIIEQGETGFLCNNDDEWKNSLIQLMKDSNLRNRLGLAARQKVITDYAVLANSANFLRLFS